MGCPLSLAKKLLIKPSMNISLVNAPEGYSLSPEDLPPAVTLVTDPEPGSLDFMMFFVKSLAELDERGPQAMALVKYDALAWLAYPKKTSKIKTDIDRDNAWAKMRTWGFAGVAMVAIDETWSAMRYRPAERVGK